VARLPEKDSKNTVRDSEANTLCDGVEFCKGIKSPNRWHETVLETRSEKFPRREELECVAVFIPPSACGWFFWFHTCENDPELWGHGSQVRVVEGRSGEKNIIATSEPSVDGSGAREGGTSSLDILVAHWGGACACLTGSGAVCWNA